MGIFTIGFSKPNATNDVSHLADKHYNISIDEIDRIVEICKSEQVNGVVTSGSDFAAVCTNDIACRLGAVGNNHEKFIRAMDKHFVREKTAQIPELKQVQCCLYNGNIPNRYPVIIKPQTAGGKVGLTVAKNSIQFVEGIRNARHACDCEILIEEYVEGMKISVEALSYHGKHYVIQTCEAETSGAPNFVEIAHHLPGNIQEVARKRILVAIPKILDAIEFENGATDIDMKVDTEGNLYLIEVNLRGGGGNLASKLVELSTGFSYPQGQVEIALDGFQIPTSLESHWAGDYYLCSQSESLVPLFKVANKHKWLVESNIKESHFDNLTPVKINGDRDGYIIYQADHKITIKDA